ncbi:MAG: hypothetical protein WDO18_05295 [Acidobacteriota bacterium]
MKRFSLLFALMSPTIAQLAGQVLPFNDAGVTMGHHHIIVPNVAAQKRVWWDVLGGQLSGNAPLEFVKFPGAFLILSTGNTTQGTEGSALDHIAFAVKDFKMVRDKLVAAGVKVLEEDPEEIMTLFPDGIKVEFYEDKTLTTPIAHRAMHFMSADPEAERAWWETAFGAQTLGTGAREWELQDHVSPWSGADVRQGGYGSGEDAGAGAGSHGGGCEECGRVLHEAGRARDRVRTVGSDDRDGDGSGGGARGD